MSPFCFLMWTTVNSCTFGSSRVDSLCVSWAQRGACDRGSDLFTGGQQFTSRITLIPHGDRYVTRPGPTLWTPPDQQQQSPECRLFSAPPISVWLWASLASVWKTSNAHFPRRAQWCVWILTPHCHFWGYDSHTTAICSLSRLWSYELQWLHSH